MSDWKYRILKDWNFMRILRLGMSVFILIEAVKNYDLLFGIIAGILLLQAVLNLGCCSSGACYSGKVEQKDQESKEVIFEEIKSKK